MVPALTHLVPSSPQVYTSFAEECGLKLIKWEDKSHNMLAHYTTIRDILEGKRWVKLQCLPHSCSCLRNPEHFAPLIMDAFKSSQSAGPFKA
jgi:hypothetical protein